MKTQNFSASSIKALRAQLRAPQQKQSVSQVYDAIYRHLLISEYKAPSASKAELARKLVPFFVGLARNKPANLSILISGRTGCGKTTLQRVLAEIFEACDLTILRVNGGSVTPEGYWGQSVSESFERISPLAVSRGAVVLFDECDKLVDRDGCGENFIHQVQKTLLPIVGGEMFSVGHKTFDLSKTMVVGFGVFDKARSKWSRSDELAPTGWRQALVESGFIPEFVGRWTHLLEMERPPDRVLEEIIKFHGLRIQNLYGIDSDKCELRSTELKRLLLSTRDSEFGVRSLLADLHGIFEEKMKNRLPPHSERGFL